MVPEELIFKGSEACAQYRAFNIDKHEGEKKRNKPEYQSFMLYFRSPAILYQEEIC